MSIIAALKARIAKLAPTAADDADAWLTGASDEHLDSKRKVFDSIIKDSHEVLHDGGNVDQEALRGAIRNMRKVDGEIERRQKAKQQIEQRQKIEQQPAPAAAPAKPAPIASLASKIKALAHRADSETAPQNPPSLAGTPERN